MEHYSITAVLNDPCTHTWLKNALRAALECDPVDMASDAEFLTAILKARAARFCREVGR